jgi:hypothetical protein
MNVYPKTFSFLTLNIWREQYKTDGIRAIMSAELAKFRI